jgi:hypothetical protein
MKGVTKIIRKIETSFVTKLSTLVVIVGQQQPLIKCLGME